MKSNLFLRVISVLLVIFHLGDVKAASVPPAQAVAWAEQNGRQLLDTFRDPDISRRYAALDSLFLQYVDLSYIGKFVVGKYWREMTPVQQEAYLTLFSRYALALYKTFPLDFADSLSYEVGRAEEEGAYTTVSATVHVQFNPNNPPQDFLLQFRLHQTPAGIKLVDIKLAESSLILSYRSKFYQLLAEDDGDIGWFLEDLEVMTRTAENNNSTQRREP